MNKKRTFLNKKASFLTKIDKKSEIDCYSFLKILAYIKYPQPITIKSFTTSAKNCLDL